MINANLPIQSGKQSFYWTISDIIVMTKRNLLRYIRLPQLLVFSTIQPVAAGVPRAVLVATPAGVAATRAPAATVPRAVFAETPVAVIEPLPAAEALPRAALAVTPATPALAAPAAELVPRAVLAETPGGVAVPSVPPPATTSNHKRSFAGRST
jgi:hypothetical protein